MSVEWFDRDCLCIGVVLATGHRCRSATLRMRQTQLHTLEASVQPTLHRGHDPAVAQLRFGLQGNWAKVTGGVLDLDALAVLKVGAWYAREQF